MSVLVDKEDIIAGLLRHLRGSPESEPQARKPQMSKTQVCHPKIYELPTTMPAPGEQTRRESADSDAVEVMQDGNLKLQKFISSSQPPIQKHSNGHFAYCDLSQSEEQPEWAVGASGRDLDSMTNKGANHKRGSKDHLKEHRSTFYTQTTTEEDDRDDRDVRKRIQVLIDLSDDQTPLSPVKSYDEDYSKKHEVTNMLEVGIGRVRTRRHLSRAEEGQEDLAEDEKSSSPSAKQIREIAESPEPYDQSLVVNAKHIKLSTAVKVRQHSSQAHPEKVETSYAHTDDYACDPDHTKNKDAPKKREPWLVSPGQNPEVSGVNPTSSRPAAARYKNPKAHSGVDYSMPINGPVPPGVKKRPNVAGGPQPLNRLHSSNNPAFRHQDPRNTTKKFDLQNGDVSGRPTTGMEPPAKRQKRDAASEKHSQVMGLDAPSQKTPSARSGNSRTQNGRSLSNGSSQQANLEFRATEHAVWRKKVRRRQSQNDGVTMNHQQPKTGSFKAFIPPKGNRDSVVRLDNPSDAIIDDEAHEEVMLIPIGPETPMKMTAQVLMRSFNPNRDLEIDELYQSTGSSRPSKSRVSETTSHHFSRPKRQDSVECLSDTIQSRPRTRASTQRNGEPFDLESEREGNSSPDELSRLREDDSEAKYVIQAKKLLSRRREMKGESAADSRDELHGNISDNSRDADLPKFFERRKSTKGKGKELLEITQLFCQTHDWLSGGLIGPLFLEQCLGVRGFRVVDSEGNDIPDFESISVKITALMRSKVDGKIILSKPRDIQVRTMPRNAYQIYMALRDSGQSDRFCVNMEPITGPAKTQDDEERMKKEFLYVFNGIKFAQEHRRPQDDSNADKFMAHNEPSQKRTSDSLAKALADKPARDLERRDQMLQNEADAYSSGPSQSHNTRSSVGSRRHSEFSEVDSRTFYSNKTSLENRSINKRPIRELAPRPPPREPTPTPLTWTKLHPGWSDEWTKSIVFPKVGRNRATIEPDDIRRLDEGEFLNDNLVAFYMLHLELEFAKRSPDLSKRVYFHNSFFYQSLSKPEKGKRGINYEAVRRWTSRVDLFSYDYIIVPVNEHTHWYLAIICNAPRLLNPVLDRLEESHSAYDVHGAADHRMQIDSLLKSDPASPNITSSPSDGVLTSSLKRVSLDGGAIDLDREGIPVDEAHDKPKALSTEDQSDLRVQDIEMASSNRDGNELPKSSPAGKKFRKKSVTQKYDIREPRIITLDSLGISHSPTCANLKDYLIAEMKEKHGKTITPGALGMKAVHIPEQQNYCDCGLFLLSYIEEFLKNPDKFAHALLQKTLVDFSQFRLAPDLRNHMRKLLRKLNKERQEEDKAESAKKPRKDIKGKPKNGTQLSKQADWSEPKNAARSSADAQLDVSMSSPTPAETSSKKSSRRGSHLPALDNEPVLQPPDVSLAGESNGMGALTLPVKRLLEASGKSVDQPDDTSGRSHILLEEQPRSGSRASIAPVLGTVEPFFGVDSDSRPPRKKVPGESNLDKKSPKRSILNDGRKKGRTASDALPIDESPKKRNRTASESVNGDPSAPTPVEKKLGSNSQDLSSPTPEPAPNFFYPSSQESMAHSVKKPSSASSRSDDQYQRVAEQEDDQSPNSSPLQAAPKPEFQANGTEHSTRHEIENDSDPMLLDSPHVSLLEDVPSTSPTTPAKRNSTTDPALGSIRKDTLTQSRSAGPHSGRRSTAYLDAGDAAIAGQVTLSGPVWAGTRMKF